MVPSLYRRTETTGRLGDLIAAFAGRIEPSGFPCMFAARSLVRDELLFGATGWRLLDDVLALMRAAATAIRETPDQVVVLFLDTPTRSLDDERELAALVLRHLRRNDREPWPADAPTDPRHPQWVFRFEGIDFFVNFSTPAHRRRSRNLGPVATMIVQSRSSFDGIAAAVRDTIRSRVGAFDGMPAHPAIGTYGDPASREATQYFLGDSNESTVDLLGHDEIHPLPDG